MWGQRPCSTVGHGYWLGCLSEWRYRLCSVAVQVFWPGFWVGWNHRLCSAVRQGWKFASLPWSGQTVLPIELPGQKGPPVHLCWWAELLAGFSAWAPLQTGMQLARFRVLVTINLDSFSISIWFPGVELCRFSQWSPWGEVWVGFPQSVPPIWNFL